MSGSVTRHGSQEKQVGRLVLAGALVLLLPAVPLGSYLIYPFAILTTWFHEMGHGLTMLATGNDFVELVILPDGSGWARSSSMPQANVLSRALVAIGGPLGPSVVGALLILASSKHRYWKAVLLALSLALLASSAIWVRSMTGWAVLPLVAATLVWVAWRGKPWLQLFALQFLGVLAGLSMFTDWDYLFSEVAVVGGEATLSDTGAIEQVLWLPHWVWAVLIVALSGLMVGASLKYALNHKG